MPIKPVLQMADSIICSGANDGQLWRVFAALIISNKGIVFTSKAFCGILKHPTLLSHGG
jgi:hypothetical protein